MNATRIGAVAAALVLAGMLVPVGAALPSQASQHAVTHANGHIDAAPQKPAGPGGSGGDASEADTFHGPPVDMPSQVPGFVIQIHEAVRAFLQGDLSAGEMADSIQEATPGNETAAE